MEQVQTVSSTGMHMNCLTTQGGQVYCWGNNDYGTIGDGTSLTNRDSPTRVDVTALDVSLGYRFVCARTLSGGVQCWGRGSVGQLGNNAGTSSLTPVDVYGLASGVSTLSAGSAHACAVKTDGRLMCWGSNQYGELGNGAAGTYLVKPMFACTNTTSCTPHFSDVAQVSAGTNVTCAVKNDGALYCWGSNIYGRLGLGQGETQHELPQLVTALPNVARVAVGEAHVCALTKAGALYCWGSNNVGQLGDGTKLQRNLPVLVLAQGVSDFAVGSSHTCAVLSGSVKCWGGNDFGQLGDGTIDDHALPSFVLGLADQVSAVSAGTDHTCAILLNGLLQCWGGNGDGELGDTGTVQSSPAPVYVVRDF
jgi:alpha-tubulin suppressor-like RCC1 family protein